MGGESALSRENGNDGAERPSEDSREEGSQESGDSKADGRVRTSTKIVDQTPIDPILMAILIQGRELWPHPPRLKFEVLSKDPNLGICQQFLTIPEAREIVSLAEAKGFVPSHTGSTTQGNLYSAMDSGNPYEGLDITHSKTRTAMVSILEPDDHPIVAVVMERVSLLAECHMEQVECLSVVRYVPGQFFKEHHDGAFRPQTVFLYLNTVPKGDGGETSFPYVGYKIRPLEGMAAMWDNTIPGTSKADVRTIHEGLPTTETTKYGINCFINAQRVQRKLVNVPPHLANRFRKPIEGVQEQSSAEDKATEEVRTKLQNLL